MRKKITLFAADFAHIVFKGYHDHDVHIHNENNVYNNTTNNEGDVTNNGAQQGGQEVREALIGLFFP